MEMGIQFLDNRANITVFYLGLALNFFNPLFDVYSVFLPLI